MTTLDVVALIAEKNPLTRLRERYATLSSAAVADDSTETFPTEGVDVLRESGCLMAVLPPSRGGVGLGWASERSSLLFSLLRAMGGTHLSCARLFEGHVNAFQLLWTFGDALQRNELCDYIDEGGLLGVWNAPSPQGELVLSGCDNDLVLLGPKAYASGAGGIRRPLVTARHPERGLLMVWPETAYHVGDASEWQMHGMRASMTRSVSFHCHVHPSQIFGHHDDYHAQPHFSGGSWRFLAAQLGAGEAMAEMMRVELSRRGRMADAHQRARMAQCVTELATAEKWIRDSAGLLADAGVPVARIIQHANEARFVVERSLLRVIELVQRSVGLQLFSRAHPCERMMRDLATYLRQPAPDALVEAIGEHAFAYGFTTLFSGIYDEER